MLINSTTLRLTEDFDVLSGDNTVTMISLLYPDYEEVYIRFDYYPFNVSVTEYEWNMIIRGKDDVIVNIQGEQGFDTEPWVRFEIKNRTTSNNTTPYDLMQIVAKDTNDEIKTYVNKVLRLRYRKLVN